MFKIILWAMENRIIIFLLLISSCKKKDCDTLHQRVEASFAEYETASEINKANPTTQDSLIAVEKYNEYEDAHNDFIDRGCYYSKYVNKWMILK